MKILKFDTQNFKLFSYQTDLDNVGVVELPEVVDARVLLLLDLLDGHELVLQFANEDCTLSTRPQPL